MTTITEELTSAQKKRVDKYKIGNNPTSVAISKHVIPLGTDRLTIPLSDPSDKKLEAPSSIKDHLAKHGVEVHDYVNGHAKDKYGRMMKIGKALQQTNAPAELINHFNSDPERANAKQHANLQVVVSRHPYDVAGMSTNRAWTSCMDMDCKKKGNISNAHYLHREIKNGTHVAYLTQKGDDDVKHPVARIALKPFTSEDGTHHLLRPENKQYGSAASSFEHTVNGWINEHFKPKDGMFYHMHHTSYNDGEAENGVVVKHITDDMVKRSLPDIEDFNWDTKSGSKLSKRANAIQHVATHGTQEQRHMITDHLLGKRVPFGIGYSLLEHGGHDIHKKFAEHPKMLEGNGLGENLANMGNDEIRHHILKNTNDTWAAGSAVADMKDKSSLVQYKDHPSEMIRGHIARIPELQHHFLNDSSPLVRGHIAIRTDNKEHFDAIITPEAKADYLNKKISGNQIGEHPVRRAFHNTKFGQPLRTEMDHSYHKAMHEKHGDDWI